MNIQTFFEAVEDKIPGGICWFGKPTNGLRILYDPALSRSVFSHRTSTLSTPLKECSFGFSGDLSIRTVGILLFCVELLQHRAVTKRKLLRAYRTQCRYIFCRWSTGYGVSTVRSDLRGSLQ